MPDFIPGLKLCELFYQEAVKPLLDDSYPGLQYCAALIGNGSEVLGFDDVMSSDHNWGPRLLIFLSEEAAAERISIQEELSQKLPDEFRGYTTDFLPPHGSHPPDRSQRGVVILTFPEFIYRSLSFDLRQEMQPADWLTFPQHVLREVTSGAIYHDDIQLQQQRDRFIYYPCDIWLYLLMASWIRIGQEQHLMGRAGFAGDEIGSALIGSRLAREVMRLCFLMEKQYAPYPKWLGTAFMQLKCGNDLSPILLQAQVAQTWQEREKHLCASYEYIGAMHDALHITPPLSVQVIQFHDRPFHVIDTESLVKAIGAAITNSEVKRIAKDLPFGGIDHISDSPDFLMRPEGRLHLRSLYH